MIVDTARTAAELLAPYFAGREGDVVAVLHLDSGRRLLDTTVSAGKEGELPVRDILAAALRLGSAALIVARNHPGGGADPTEADRAAARRLAEAATALGVRLADHLVFAAGGECRSFRGLGLL